MEELIVLKSGKIEIECTNTIDKVKYNGKSISYPWSIETADRSSFYSSDHGVGWRYTEKEAHIESNVSYFSVSKSVKMLHGLWKFTDILTVGDNCLYRETKLSVAEKSEFLDFVQRFRFSKKDFHIARIDGNDIEHKKSEVYHQYEVDRVRLVGKDVSLEIISQGNGDLYGFKNFMYVRDSGEEWIVHARMLPISEDNFVFKICNSWYKTKPLPKKINDLLARSKILRRYFLYKNELRPYNRIVRRVFSLNGYKMKYLKKNDELCWKTRINFQDQ